MLKERSFMKSISLTNILLLTILVLLLIFNLTPKKNSSNRYSIFVKGTEFPYEIIKIDKETGRVWLLTTGGVHFQKELEIGGSVLEVSQEGLDSLKKYYGEIP